MVVVSIGISIFQIWSFFVSRIYLCSSPRFKVNGLFPVPPLQLLTSPTGKEIKESFLYRLIKKYKFLISYIFYPFSLTVESKP